MRKVAIAFTLVLVCLMCIGCDNGSSSPNGQDISFLQPTKPTKPLMPVEYETLEAVSSAGDVGTPTTNAESGEITLECTDSEGGKYVFVQPNARTAVVTGTWKYTRDDKILFSGVFEGDISSEDLENLTLNVTQAANEDGEMMATKGTNSFVFEITENTFTVTIPAVEIVLLECTLDILAYGEEETSEGSKFKRICNEFMAVNPNIKIKYEILYDEAYHQRLVSRLADNNVPDIGYMGADERWGGYWQEANQQIDNTPYYPSNIDTNLVPDFFGTGDKPYLPLGSSNFCTIIGVNMNLLNKIGGKLPTTYAEFKQLAALCKDNGIECLSTHGADAWVWGSCVMSAIIPRLTGDPKWIEKAVAGEVRFTDANFIAALDVLSQWVKDGILSETSATTTGETGLSNFASGRTLMYLDGQWGFSERNFGELSKDIKLIPIPPVPGEVGCAGSVAGAWQVGYGITRKGASDSKVLAAAKEWLKFFFSNEETIQLLEDGAIAGAIVKDFEVPEGMDPILKEKAKLGAYPSCYVIDSYLSGNANDVLNAGMQEIVAGTKTASQVATDVQNAFDAQ